MMQLKNRKVVVTGAAGFIGSELVRQLIAGGAQVTAIDNLVNGKRENLAGLEPTRLNLAVADIRDRALMAELIAGADIVFHLACLGVRHSLHSPRENHDVNATATLDLLEVARSGGVGRFVYVSSSEVYGTAQWVPMTEQHPTWPMTVYGGGKLAGESYTRAYWQSYGYPTTVVRPFNAFGPRSHHEGDCGEVIPKFMLRAMAGKPLMVFGDGTQTRDFTYVADTARGILLAGISDAAIGETINLGSGREITVGELATIISQLVCEGGAQVEYDEPRPGDVLRLFADSTKGRDLLGFQPKVSLRDGLAKLLEWYHSQGVAAEDLLRTESVRNWVPSNG